MVPMDVEKTMEFILDMQAKNEERWAKADRRMDRLERLVERLARSGLSLRSDVQELKKFRRRTEQNLAEITEKLDALIDVVDKSIRRNGRKG
jgi:L-lactate utilization protein LutB